MGNIVGDVEAHFIDGGAGHACCSESDIDVRRFVGRVSIGVIPVMGKAERIAVAGSKCPVA
jgi:hypothetical protein